MENARFTGFILAIAIAIIFFIMVMLDKNYFNSRVANFLLNYKVRWIIIGGFFMVLIFFNMFR